MSEERSAGPPAEEESSEYVTLDRPRALRAFDRGALAGLVVAIVYGFLWGAGVLQFGLVAIAVMGGWLIGAAIRHGAWRGSWRLATHVPSRRLKLLGVVIGSAAWFGGAFVAYVVSRALLPESDLSFVERLADVSFAEYLNQQYEAGGPLHGIALAVMAIMGWRTAR
jgi:hypothetical protein